MSRCCWMSLLVFIYIKQSCHFNWVARFVFSGLLRWRATVKQRDMGNTWYLLDSCWQLNTGRLTKHVFSSFQENLWPWGHTIAKLVPSTVSSFETTSILKNLKNSEVCNHVGLLKQAKRSHIGSKCLMGKSWVCISVSVRWGLVFLVSGLWWVSVQKPWK